MKRKGKKPKRYSIVIVPEGHVRGRRLCLPPLTLPLISCVLGTLILIVALSVGGAVYYRSGWLATKDVREKAAELDLEKARITEKLVSIETVAERTNRLAGTLETVMGISKKGLGKNIGPIAEDEDIPNPNSLLSAKKYELGGNQDSSLLASFDGLELKMGELEDVLSSVEMRLHDVYEYHNGKITYWASIPSVWPVRGWVTSNFGVRRSPRGVGTRFHEGIDIAAPSGTVVKSPGDGIVTFAGYKHGLGKTVIINHGFGVSTVYGHNSQLFVKEGDHIRRGTTISAVGRTGRTTGPHLHYQVIVDGMPVDPMQYIMEGI